MSAAQKLAPMITEPLTWTEICERYPDQRCAWSRWIESIHMASGFRTARVIGYGKTRGEAFAQDNSAIPMLPEDSDDR